MVAILAFALFALTAPKPTPSAQMAKWISDSTITVFRFAEQPNRRARGFNGFDILCSSELNAEDHGQLIQFLGRVKKREIKEEKEAARRGQVTGGAPGCLGWDFGIRFASSSRTADTFFCPRCASVFPADMTNPNDSVHFILTDSEARWLNDFIEAHLSCEGKGGCA